MDRRVEELTRRPLYVYDLPHDILTTLEKRIEIGTNFNVPVESAPKEVEKKQYGTDSGARGSTSCSLCNITFSTVEDQRSHVRSDLHRYNLKQRLRGLPAVSENEFERLIGDLDESLSGSDSEDSEEEDDDQKETTLTALLKKQAAITANNDNDMDHDAPRKKKRGSGTPPLIWFRTPLLPTNIWLGIYRAIFTNSERENETEIVHIIRKKQLSPSRVSKSQPDNDNAVPPSPQYNDPHIFLCMIGGGHFAAMVVSLNPKQTRSSGSLAHEATILAHKTFHRYTTRRKQGGSQSANDSAKGAAHSAGSSLRRYNEAALMDEVRLLLSDWKGMINSSELLFVRATGNTNRRILFGPYEGQILRQNDARVRGFPFSTRRATQHELMRSFLELTRVKVQKVEEISTVTTGVILEQFQNPESGRKATKLSPPTMPKRSEEEEIATLHTAQIQALIRRSKLPALLSYLVSNNLSSDFIFYPQDAQQNYHASTPLHLAASVNSSTLVSGLLIKAGANPTVLNGDGKPAFDLAGDRATRDAFRVARSSLGDNRWNWDAAHVPSALTKLEASEREERERQEKTQREEQRRKAETERLQSEGPKVEVSGALGKAAGKGRALALGHAQKTAREKREEETRGLTSEMRIKLEREQRARAAEVRIRNLQGGA